MKPWERSYGDAKPWERKYDAPSAPTESLARGIEEYGAPEGGFLAGVGKGFVDIGRGIKDAYTDNFGTPEARAANDAEIARQRELDAPLMSTGAGVAGNLVGNVAAAVPAMFIPGANTLIGGAAIGAGMSALQPTVGDERGANMWLGAGFGAGGNLAARGVAGLLAPKVDDAARGLFNEGVRATPGQMLGRTVSRIEQGIESVPILGDAIKAAKRAAVEDFNIAAGNRVLAPIGAKVPKDVKAGNDMVKYVGDELSNAYDNLIPRLNVIRDSQFDSEIANLANMVDDLADGGKQYSKIIQNRMLDRFAPNGGMHGKTLKEVESQLGQMARRYRASADGDQQRLADAIQEAQASLRRLVERSNPDARKELAAINEGWAMLTRIEKAASAAGSREGVFSPAALRGAVKAMDSSTRKRAVSRGDALLQDFAQDAESVLGPTVPDSGTPFRLMTGGLLGGLSVSYDPSILAGAAALGSMYGTNAGRAGMAATIMRRPEFAGLLADKITKYGTPVAPAIGAGLLNAR